MFTGRRFDPEAGMYDYRNRYYAPELGRFVSRDPAGYADCMNLYCYAKGNPAGYADAFGLQIAQPGQSNHRALTCCKNTQAVPDRCCDFLYAGDTAGGMAADCQDCMAALVKKFGLGRSAEITLRGMCSEAGNNEDFTAIASCFQNIGNLADCLRNLLSL